MSEAGRRLSPLPFILPLVLFLLIPMAISSLVTTRASDSTGDNAREVKPDEKIAAVPTPTLLLWYAGVTAIVCALVTIYWRSVYLATFPLRIDAISILVGVIGAALWIGLCSLNVESKILVQLGLTDWVPPRAAINPFETFSGGQLVGFLIARFSLLILIVPLAEELFLRGWLVRWIAADREWAARSLKSIGWASLVWVLVYAVFSHPHEAIAAIVWFAMINELMRRTGNFWNCVVAHAVTNAILGVWIISTGDWRLW